VSTVQSPAQAVAPHENGAHGCVRTAGQAPAPSQAAASVAVPEAHEAARHAVVAPGYAHAVIDVPLQVPPHGAAPAPAHGARAPTGAPTTAEQVPTFPATLHAWHCPPHAALQHTPSTQLPFAHSPAAAQAAPFARGTSHACAALQKRPAAQSATVVQVVLQVVVAQA
jgi:hypothetical protein